MHPLGWVSLFPEDAYDNLPPRQALSIKCGLLPLIEMSAHRRIDATEGLYWHWTGRTQ